MKFFTKFAKLQFLLQLRSRFVESCLHQCLLQWRMAM